MTHPVIHFEIHGKNGPELQEFYRKAFGWKVDANNPMQYGMVPADGGGIGGGVTGSEAPMVTVYLQADDLQAALDKATSAGAQVVMPPMDVPGGPSIAQFRDPAGNVVGLVKGM